MTIGLLACVMLSNQSAFVNGGSIAENTLIAQELVHTMKAMRGKHGLMMMKLDMEKA